METTFETHTCPQCGETMSLDPNTIIEHVCTEKSTNLDNSALNIYLIMPVREVSYLQEKECEEYVASLEDLGHTVFFPKRDAKHDDTSGYNLVMGEIEAIATADEVHVMWDVYSYGSHFDLGVAMALSKPIKLIKAFYPDSKEQSYFKVIQMWELVDVE